MRARLIKKLGLVTMVLVAIGCGSSKQDATAAPPTEGAANPSAASAAMGSASVKGSVAFKGTPPAAATIKMDADPVCQLQHAQGRGTEEIVVANGLLANVFVYVKSGLEGKQFPAPPTPVTLDQQGCWYQPHVLGLQVNQPLEIVNSDQTLHNINVKPAINQPFNIAQPM